MSTPLKLNQTSFFTRKVVPVAALLSEVVNVSGNRFICKKASGQFYMRFDQSEEFPMETGLGFALEPGDFFSSLTFRNASASDDIEIEFYCGRGEINLVVVESKLPSTRILAGGPDGDTSIAGASTITLPGTNAGQMRKQVVITNLSSGEQLYVKKGSVLCATIFPLTAWTIETDAELVIANTAVSSINLQILETFYTS